MSNGAQKEAVFQNKHLVLVLIVLIVIIIALIIGIVMVKSPFLPFSGNMARTPNSCNEKGNNYSESVCLNDISEKAYGLYIEKYREEGTTEAFLAGLEYYNQQYDNAEDVSLKNKIAASRVRYCVSYEEYEKAFDYSSVVDEESLTQDEKYYYFTDMSAMYYGLGNEERGLKYKGLAMNNMTEEIMKNGRG